MPQGYIKSQAGCDFDTPLSCNHWTMSTRAKIPEFSISKAFHPTWRKSVLALLAAILMGIVGMVLYFDTLCLTGTNDCAAYSLNELVIAKMMAWPIFAVQEFAFGGSSRTFNFDPVLDKYWWLIVSVLWLYYYVIFATATLVANWIRSLWARD
jgi:hypothetical protein